MLRVGSAVKSRARNWWLLVCLVLVLQAVASRVVSIPERDPALPDLNSLPTQLGPWEQRGTLFLDEGTKEQLHPDEYVLRDYVNRNSGAPMNLFVAYFKTSQGRYGPHSPRVCLPGAGWQVRSLRTSSLFVPGSTQSVPVNEYVLEKSGNRIVVVYWYQNDRAAWAGEFWAKLRLLPDLIRYHCSDLSLVRLVSPAPSGDGGVDFSDSVQFAKLLFPVLARQFAMAAGGKRGA